MIEQDTKHGIEKMEGPWRITFDTNPDDCNLNCIMCEEFSPYSDLKQLRVLNGGPKRRRMSIELIEPVIRAGAEMGNLKEIIPSTMGEPLLYKHFDRLIEMCHKYGVKLNLTTNGTFPKKSPTEWAELLVPITSDVKISWNGATKQTAEQVMLGVDFDQHLSNVKDFIAVRDKIHQAGGNFCRVTLQVTFMEMNYEEFPDLVKLAVDLGINRLKGHHLWAHFDEIKDQSMRKDPETIRRWNNTVGKMEQIAEEYRLPGGEKILLDNIYKLSPGEGTTEISHDAICPFLGREVWVAWNGRFNPCCAPDAKRKTLGYFGNLQEESLEEIWDSTEYTNLVENYLDNDLCKSCNMRRPREDVP